MEELEFDGSEWWDDAKRERMSLKLAAFAEDSLKTDKFRHVKRVRSLGRLGWSHGELKILRALAHSSSLQVLGLCFYFDYNEGPRTRKRHRRAVRAAWREIAGLQRADHVIIDVDWIPPEEETDPDPNQSYMDYWDEASEGDEYDEDDDDWGPSDTLLKLRARKIAAARTDRDQKVELSDHESDAESYKGTYVPRERQFGIWNWKEGEPFVNESYPQAKLPQNVTRLTLERTIGRLNAKVDRVTIDADYHDVFLARGLRPRSLEISNGEVWEQELGNYLEEPPETDELERVVINLAKYRGVQRLILRRVPTVNLLSLPAGLKELDIVPSDGDLDDPRQILNVPTERLGDLKRSIREAQLERLFVSGLDQYEYSGGEERECWKEIIAEHGKRFREADD